MRLQLLAVLATGLSLVNCSFDGGGITGNTAVTVTNDASTTDGGTTDVDPTTSDNPTMDAVCGNYNTDPGEECDNGPEGNGTGGVCKSDCTKNVCGDSYIANFNETCDDGNTENGDGCNSMCKSEACGNNVKEDGEECDDGNVSDADGCTSLCRIAECGDGLTYDGVEECDEGMDNADDGACTAACKDAVCGDGLVQAGVEQCDDDNAVDNDGCSNTCMSASCGDGVKNGDEECDDPDGNADDKACKADCTENVCGDGKVEADAEECDDPGGNADNKACKSDCTENVCGDGKVEEGVEDCDDDNTEDGDNCTSVCTTPECGDMLVSDGEDCDDGNAVSTDDCIACVAAECGDGFLHAGSEQCDDGNETNSGDTCDNNCMRKAFWVFVSSEMKLGGDVVSPDMMDAFCTQLSVGTDVEGKYAAWLSESDKPVAAHLGQMSMFSNIKFIRPDGMTVADNYGDLLDPDMLANPINIDETGATVVDGACTDPGAAVWTGSETNGMPATSHCLDWMSSASDKAGQAGRAAAKNDEWTDACPLLCNKMARVYCFEQP